MSNNNEAEKRWECFATLCKEMNELADEIIEWSEDGHYRDRLIHLYDLADTVFGAKNVKRLLAALEEKEQLSFQRLSENHAVRDELGFDADANYVTLMGLRNAIRALRLRAEAAEQRLQHPIIPAQSSNEVNDAAWKLHNMLTEHGPLNGHQFNNLKGCFYEALKVCMGPNKTLQPALADVMEERERQISAKGYHLDHDDTHVNDEIAALAAWYVMPPGAREWNTTSTGYGDTLGEAILPGWNQPSGKDRRRELVIGAALTIAEIERLDRAAAKVEGE
ncbi:hypothetical protein [Serratia fonticola]|uniref:hypothetical protein n=1 Tax=Serratia fonticola TaxID=47917 RepID=UPI00040AE356|nr:hypothetical protein [Serratia fonticola]